MARIFISHNSNDAKEAVALKRWLADNGWDDTFLDIDAKGGLSPGERWKDALKNATDRCEAVLCLISPTWLASPECKLEFRYAETLRKHLFLALIKPCNTQELPPDWQWCPLFGDGAQTTIRFDFREQATECAFLSDGLARLKIGLQKAGISAEYFPWPPGNDPERSPYRGLKPLEAADAAVFFGRNAQVLHGMEALWDMRRNGIERMLVILGASGSGKSSFMRAGLLPRLARDDRQFFTLPVIRPRNAVVFGAEGLAPALTAAFGQLGGKITLGEIENWLNAGPEAFNALLLRLEQFMLNRILGEADVHPPSIVFAIDQAEELFNPDGAAEALSFLALLAGVLADSGTEAGPVVHSSPRERAIVVLTIRSDRYERLQITPGLSGVKPRLFDLRPFPPGQFERVINGPAERATQAGRKLTIDSRLTERLLTDFSEGADTLPLLGFALEKLYHKYGSDGDLTLEDYDAIRGSEETVQAAIFQETIDTALQEPYRPPVIPTARAEQEHGLRRAFIPFLARINPENNEPMRQVAKLAELPADVHPLVERLVEARLLIRDKDAIEVAHESLLRQWPKLRGWLSEDLDNLILRDSIRRLADEWKKEGQRVDMLATQGERLTKAEALLATPGYVVAADSDERAYLNACREEQEKREADKKKQEKREISHYKQLAEQQTKAAEAAEVARVAGEEARVQAVEFAMRSRKQTRIATGIALVAGIFLLGAIGFGYQAYVKEKAAQRAKADADYQSASGKLAFGRADESLPLLAHALRSDSAYLPGQGQLLDLLGRRSWPLPLNKPLPHEQTVTSVQFSSDGTRVLTVSGTAAQVWDAATGKAVTEPLRHNHGVNSARFSADGNSVVTASSDKTARIWDAKTGMALTAPLLHEGSVMSAQFSPDGTRLVTVSYSSEFNGPDTAKIWDAKTGTSLTGQLQHQGWVNSVDFSPDGTRVVTASNDKTARIWDVATGKALTEPLHHDDDVNFARFSPDGAYVVTASSDKTAQIWDAATGKSLNPPLRHEGRVISAQFSPNGTRVVTASYDKTARVWDTVTGKAVTAPLRHNNRVNSAQFSPDSMRVVTASFDNTVRIWDAATGKTLTEPLWHDKQVNSANFSSDGTRVLTISGDNNARIWDVKPRMVLSEPLQHGGRVNSVAFSPDGTRVLTASDDEKSRVWDAVTGHLVTGPMDSGGMVGFAHFSRDGARVVTVSGYFVSYSEGTAQVWDAKSGEAVGEPLSHPEPIYSARFSSDGSRVVTASADTTARIWDAKTGKALTDPFQHAGWVYSAEFSPNDAYVLTASDDGKARIWDAKTGKSLTELLHKGSVRSAQFNSDGTRVVTASDDETALVWDANTGKAVTEPLRHGDAVNYAQFSPDGTLVVTASADTTARIWDAKTGEALTKPLRHGSGVRSARFSQDGKRVVTASLDNTFRIWDVKTGEALTEPLHHGAGDVSPRLNPGATSLATTLDDDTTVQTSEEGSVADSAESSRHLNIVDSAQFNRDGTHLVTAGDDGTALVWDIPTLSSSDAEWVASLAEAVAGYRVSEQGVVVPVDDALNRLAQLRAKTANAKITDGMGPLFVRWFLADPWERTISPLSGVTVEDYIKRRIEEGRIEEVAVLFSGHPLLTAAAKTEARLPQSLHEQTPATNNSNTERDVPDSATTDVHAKEGDHSTPSAANGKAPALPLSPASAPETEQVEPPEAGPHKADENPAGTKPETSKTDKASQAPDNVHSATKPDTNTAVHKAHVTKAHSVQPRVPNTSKQKKNSQTAQTPNKTTRNPDSKAPPHAKEKNKGSSASDAKWSIKK